MPEVNRPKRLRGITGSYPRTGPKTAVLMAQRWIPRVLWDRHYLTLVKRNAVIREQLDRINHRPMKPVEKSRFELFAALDRSALKPLPGEVFEKTQ